VAGDVTQRYGYEVAHYAESISPEKIYFHHIFCGDYCHGDSGGSDYQEGAGDYLREY
jgi:hypothetical protein